MPQRTRRRFLQWCAAGGITGTAGCATSLWSTSEGESNTDTGEPTTTATDAASETPTNTPESKEDSPLELDSEAPVDVRGAIYIPARAFNFYQMWRDYDSAVTDRDLGYATRLNLNAIRTWGSYEYWREDEAAFESAFEDFLQTSAEHGIKPLVGLFEGIGEQPTRENLTNEDLMTATGVASPSNEILRSKQRWEETREFVRWFMDRYADDDRLLAIEVINEPGWKGRRVEFARSMYETMKEMRGNVPLTVGSTSMSKNSTYADWELDLFQFHYNFPPGQPTFRQAVQRVNALNEALTQPVMLTEWQRVRTEPGFHTTQPRDQRTPNYASMAPIITDLGMSNFFWSLMLQPAYFSSQRQMGVLNGVFHEDGAVWSLEDARSLKAMSGDPSFDGEERREWPEWAKPIKKEVYGE